jgi:osmotically-inducible protein OsmY
MERYGLGSRYAMEGIGLEPPSPFGYPYSPYGLSYEEYLAGFAPSFGTFPERGYGERGSGRFSRRSLEPMQRQSAVHTWRGGVLGWLGSGVRAAAAWTGIQMQRWGSLLGGRLSESAEQIGESLEGGGERLGSALEESGVESTRGQRRTRPGRPPRLYRRPDDRILDSVYERISRSAADAEEVEIEVNDGMVTLSGNVPSKLDKRLIEELADSVFGVTEVHNHLKLARRIEGKGAEARAGEAKAGVPAEERHNGQERSRSEPPRPQP